MNDPSDRLESIVSAVPGPRSRELAQRLAKYEAPGITYLAEDYPVFWESATGAVVTDVDGNRYLDLTSAFGVAATGHANAYVAAAITDQASRLIHGMGDVHPTEVRTQLLAQLAELAPGALQKSYLTTSGSEAVEFALKTALLATKRPRVLAYHAAYHGLTLGALEVIGIDKFRAPFDPLVPQHATFLPYPGANATVGHAIGAVREALERDRDIGAILLEPIQGRGGVIIPPAGFLAGLRELCDDRGLLLILDEIYTGLGRTGMLFACEREDVVPDLLCIGKALGGGVPIAATIGTPRVMDAWPKSAGEALHTSTFLGNPLTCAAALANLEQLIKLELVARVRDNESWLAERLGRLRRLGHVRDVRGLGYFWGVEFIDAAFANRVVVEGLARGVILLQSGPTGTSITIAPPLVIDDEQLARACDLFEETIHACEEAG